MSPTSVFSHQAASSPAWGTPPPAGSSASSTPRSSENGSPPPVLFTPCWSRGSSEGGASPSPQEEQQATLAMQCANLASKFDSSWVINETFDFDDEEEVRTLDAQPLPMVPCSAAAAAANPCEDGARQYQIGMLAAQERMLQGFQSKVQVWEADSAGRHSPLQAFVPISSLRWLQVTADMAKRITGRPCDEKLAFHIGRIRVERESCLRQACEALRSTPWAMWSEAALSEREVRDVLIRHQAGQLHSLSEMEEWMQRLQEEQGALLAAFGQLRKRVPGVERAVQIELRRPGQARAWRGCKGMEVGSGAAWRR